MPHWRDDDGSASEEEVLYGCPDEVMNGTALLALLLYVGLVFVLVPLARRLGLPPLGLRPATCLPLRRRVVLVLEAGNKRRVMALDPYQVPGTLVLVSTSNRESDRLRMELRPRAEGSPHFAGHATLEEGERTRVTSASLTALTHGTACGPAGLYGTLGGLLVNASFEDPAEASLPPRSLDDLRSVWGGCVALAVLLADATVVLALLDPELDFSGPSTSAFRYSALTQLVVTGVHALRCLWPSTGKRLHFLLLEALALLGVFTLFVYAWLIYFDVASSGYCGDPSGLDEWPYFYDSDCNANASTAVCTWHTGECDNPAAVGCFEWRPELGATSPEASLASLQLLFHVGGAGLLLYIVTFLARPDVRDLWLAHHPPVHRVRQAARKMARLPETNLMLTLLMDPELRRSATWRMLLDPEASFADETFRRLARASNAIRFEVLSYLEPLPGQRGWVL